jgi:hypothetical protein
MFLPPLCTTGELIQTKDEVTTVKRQLNAMDRKLQRLLDFVENGSTLARSAPTTASVKNVQAKGMIQYSVYEVQHKKQKKSPYQLFVDWFKYELQAGYESDISQSASLGGLSGPTKSAFKRHKWVVESMLRCCDNHPPPIPDTPQQRVQWEADLGPIANAALARLKDILGLDENDTVTQHRLSNTPVRKKIIDLRPLPQNTPLDSTFRAQPRKRQRNIDTADV